MRRRGSVPMAVNISANRMMSSVFFFHSFLLPYFHDSGNIESVKREGARSKTLNSNGRAVYALAG